MKIIWVKQVRVDGKLMVTYGYDFGLRVRTFITRAQLEKERTKGYEIVENVLFI